MMAMRAEPLLSFLLSLACALGCSDERRFIGEDGFYQVALTESTSAAFAVEDGALYIVEERVELPIERPTETALQDLRQAAQSIDGLPFPRMPWLERGDLAIEVDFTLSNLDDVERQVAVIINGFNEFHEYQPGVTLIDEEPTADFSQWERLYELGPEQRVVGTVREEEFDEAAVDLATVVNGAPNSNAVVFFENKSSRDERNAQYVPVVIPGLAGFRIGLRATESGRVVLDASVRVRDAGDRLANPDDAPFRIAPAPFAPVSQGQE
jgi:hypothetical protein